MSSSNKTRKKSALKFFSVQKLMFTILTNVINYLGTINLKMFQIFLRVLIFFTFLFLPHDPLIWLYEDECQDERLHASDLMIRNFVRPGFDSGRLRDVPLHH
jgi:hypothetical protein